MWVKVTQNGTSVEVRVYEHEGAEQPLSWKEGPLADVLFPLSDHILHNTSAAEVVLGSNRSIRARYERMVVASKKVGKVRLIVEDQLPRLLTV